MSKLTKRLTAMLLSGMLAITSVSGSVFASEIDFDPGQTSEVAVEEAATEEVDAAEEESMDAAEEESMDGAAEEGLVEAVEESETTAVPEEASVDAVEEESTDAAEEESLDSTAEEAVETSTDASWEKVVEYYTVTLDANGGYFENEWDDVLRETVESTEVLNKNVTIGEVVDTFPVREQENEVVTFLGWSLERDGEIVSQEFVPAENCILYAAWEIEEYSDTDNGESEITVEDAVGEDTSNQEAAVSDLDEENAKFADENIDQTEESETEDTLQEQREEESVQQDDLQLSAEESTEELSSEGSRNEEINYNPSHPDDSDFTDNSSEKETTLDTVEHEEEKEDPAAGALSDEEAVTTEPVYEGTEMPEDAVYWAGHYYMAFDESLTPAEAAAKCEAMGGYLATATSQKEYDLIWSLISAKSNGKPAYQLMGIQKKSDGWYWDDGEEFCFSTWAGFYSKYAGDGYFTLRAGCLGWSDEEIKTAIAWGSSPLYESSYNGWGWGLYLDEGTSASEHNIAICNGTITFTRYANWGGRSSVSATGGMVEYNETNVATGYVCEWGDPIALKEEHVFLNGQTKGNESPVRYEYSGDLKQPSSIKVYYEGVELSLNQDYSYEVKARSQVGVARVNVTGINRYQGLAVKYYYIVPRKVTKPVIGRDNENRGIKLNWTGLDETTEYDVRWTTNRSDLTDNLDDTNVPVYQFPFSEEEDNTYYTGTLKRGTTYYVQVRGVGNRNYKYDVGDWSDVAEIKTGNQIIMDEFWGFSNNSDNAIKGLDLSYFYRMFNPQMAIEQYVSCGGTDSELASLDKGICYGMVNYAISAYLKNDATVFGKKSLAEIKSIQEADTIEAVGGMSVKEAIACAQIIQDREDYNSVLIQMNLKELYYSVKSCQEGVGLPVEIGIAENNSGHFIYGICIDDSLESDEHSVILVYDPNEPNVKKYLYLLKGANGEFSGWSFRGHSNNYMAGTLTDTSKGDLFVYCTEVPTKLMSDITNIASSSYDKKEARNYLRLYFKNIEKQVIENYVDNLLVSNKVTPIVPFNGNEDQEFCFWVDEGTDLDLQGVPVGTEISFSSNYHAVKAKASVTINAKLKISDDNTGGIEILPLENGECTVLYSFQEAENGNAKETKITFNLKKDQEATIEKNGENDIQAIGVTNIDYHSETGRRNEYAVIESPVSHNVEKEDLDHAKEYKMTESSDEAQILSKEEGTDNFTVIEATESEMIKKDISGAVVENLLDKYEYTGEAIEPAVVVRHGGQILKKTVDYSISYQNNVEPGTATIIVTGMGNFNGQKSFTFKIVKLDASLDISKCKIERIEPQLYTGTEIRPSVVVKNDNNQVLAEGEDYSVTYRNNISVGTATVTVNGINNYTGIIFANFEIIKDPSIEEPKIIDSGFCGTNVTWTLYEDGTFILSGTGETESYMNKTLVPWNEHMTSIKKVIAEKGITKLGDCLFYGANNLVETDLPEGITEIGGCVFQNCTSLKAIDLPDSVDTFGNWVFGYCSSLSSIVLPENTSVLGNYTFFDCASLEEVYINRALTHVGNYCFFSMQSKPHPSVFYEGTQSEWSQISFGEKNEWLLNATIQYGVSHKVKVSEIIFDQPNISIKKGTRIGLSATVKPEKAENKSLIWESSNDDVAIVNSRGVVAGIEEGTVVITATAADGSGVSASCSVTVYNADIAKANITGLTDQTYTGKALTQTFVVKMGTTTLEPDVDYTVSYSSNINVGTASATITGIGNYEGMLTSIFTISPKSITEATVTGITSKTYTGKALTQTPVVKLGTTTLNKDTDYTVAYKNNTNVGTATVTITGKGNYTGTKTAIFKINKANQSITAKSSASSIAVGKTTTVSITGAKGAKSFKSSNTAIATVTSAGKVTAKKVGTVKITAISAATANYNAASKTVTIKVVPAATTSLTATNLSSGIKLTWKKVTGANGYKVYRGSTLLKTITSGSTVTYTDTKANTNGTKYTYKVVAKATTGDSTLSKSVTVYRVARPAISSATNSAASKMTVKWDKNAKATGYQIQYCPDKTFKTGNKSVSITSASTVSKVIGSLAKCKTYYVRIRTYKTAGSTKYFSAWSSVKSVKISK